MKMNPVVHFELPAEDRKRIAKFYTEAFGWKVQQLGEEFGNYMLAYTTESDEKTGPKKPGAINGGIYQKTTQVAMQNPSIVIAVDDINESMEKVKKSGGKILMGPTDIVGVGKYVTFEDTEKNILSMLQPTEMKK